MICPAGISRKFGKSIRESGKYQAGKTCDVYNWRIHRYNVAEVTDEMEVTEEREKYALDYSFGYYCGH